jgi:hypothetical protein
VHERSHQPIALVGDALELFDLVRRGGALLDSGEVLELTQEFQLRFEARGVGRQVATQIVQER